MRFCRVTWISRNVINGTRTFCLCKYQCSLLLTNWMTIAIVLLRIFITIIRTIIIIGVLSMNWITITCLPNIDLYIKIIATTIITRVHCVRVKTVRYSQSCMTYRCRTNLCASSCFCSSNIHRFWTSSNWSTSSRRIRWTIYSRSCSKWNRRTFSWRGYCLSCNRRRNR